MTTTSPQTGNVEPSRLRFLVDDDWRSLLERARPARFSRGDVVLLEGSYGAGLCIIRTGFVRVERAHVGHGVAIARRGPGELVGEMSFLQQSGATASVVAEQDVEVSLLDREDVNAVLASVPGLDKRFYQSLALAQQRSDAASLASSPYCVMHFRLRMPRQKATSHLRCQVEWSSMPTVGLPKLVDLCWRFAGPTACSAGQMASN